MAPAAKTSNAAAATVIPNPWVFILRERFITQLLTDVTPLP
jgi:hypothetical protein